MSLQPDIDELMQRLDEFLMSDQAPPECMMLSDLDGFLTGIAIGPALILPSKWLPVIWGGEEPVFDSLVEAQAIHTAIMCRYNQILAEVEQGAPNPIFWQSKDGDVIVGDWTEGFMQAVNIDPTAWEKLFKAEHMTPYFLPILAFCCDDDGEPLVALPADVEDQITEIADQAIEMCISEIAAFWRNKKTAQNENAGPKVGRNDPCPCGSGRKFKKCCGANN
jgi:uncharacterized protein